MTSRWRLKNLVHGALGAVVVGLTPLAVDAGFVSVDLGKSRLRTETAGLAAVMMMQLSQL